MSHDFRAYGRNFTYDTGTQGVIGENEYGHWLVPSRTVPDYWDRRVNPWNPTHWPILVRTWWTGRIAFLENRP